MPEAWKPIFLSAKVFGHVSQGMYRTPAGAIKELISNSFDADAQLVRIHTDFPRFDTFSCEDNGTGISQEEFARLVNQGIGSSYKRSNNRTVSEKYSRPLIGRLGLGILALAQICSRFEIISHHKATKSAFRAVIKFPPYTREEMDKLVAKSGNASQMVQGGEYQFSEEKYSSEKDGVRIFTKYLRESFRKRMRSSLARLGNKRVLGNPGPYKSFEAFLDAIYKPHELTKSLNLLSDYDQLLFGLALAPPLQLVEQRNIAARLPSVRKRLAELASYKFKVLVDNIALANPVCIPSDRWGSRAAACKLSKATHRTFELTDGPVRENCNIIQHHVTVEASDETFNLYEFSYYNKDVAGTLLAFDGFLFQQTGRLYPRDIQGVLVRLNNVAIGKFDNSMLTYPYAEGPRYSMVTSELMVTKGFEDALNIDRDSFNELHPHYIRAQAFVHGLLHGVIFPETWSDEKERNRRRKELASTEKEGNFAKNLGQATGVPVRTITRIDLPKKPAYPKGERAADAAVAVQPVKFKQRGAEIEINQAHPLLQPLFRRKKYASLLEKLVIAFERANSEEDVIKRREMFYRLLANIFSDL